MHSGPPFASGRAHIGHMYNMVGKDAVNRFRLMQGYRVVM
jgi:isoleucyl-tRNA synthetase